MGALKKTVVLKVDPKNPDKIAIARAAAAIKEGKLVAFPTETVYGLAANRFDKDAIARLCKVKERPSGKHFTVHISDVKTVGGMGCKIEGEAQVLADKFWPGPLTMVVKSDSGENIGFRMPANIVALELIRRAGVPVIAPSANLSGKNPPTNAQEVLEQLDGRIDFLVDAGETDVGTESTVIDMTVTPPNILREGAITSNDIFKALGHER